MLPGTRFQGTVEAYLENGLKVKDFIWENTVILDFFFKKFGLSPNDNFKLILAILCVLSSRLSKGSGCVYDT